MYTSRLTRFATICALIVVAATLCGCGKTVPPGNRGVYFNWRTGTDIENPPLEEGWHWLAPWNSIYLYDVRIKDQVEKMSILTQDQLNIRSDISARFRPDPNKVAVLQVEIGEAYYQQVVGPTLRSVARDVISSYTSIEAYTKRAEIQKKIQDQVSEVLAQKNVLVEAILLRDMDFPAQVIKAIEEKIAMQQESEKMAFVLEKERKEAERKRIEAQGIADFQQIVSQGINSNLLRWKGIEATLKLAESQNAKVVVIGAGEDGMPLILGGTQ